MRMLKAWKYVGFASFVILVWDHIDTFADEVSFSKAMSMARPYLHELSQVEYIWKGKRKGICKSFPMHYYQASDTFHSMWSTVTYLFLFVRPCKISKSIRFDHSPQNRYFTPLGFIINLYGTQWLIQSSFFIIWFCQCNQRIYLQFGRLT